MDLDILCTVYGTRAQVYRPFDQLPHPDFISKVALVYENKPARLDCRSMAPYTSYYYGVYLGEFGLGQDTLPLLCRRPGQNTALGWICNSWLCSNTSLYLLVPPPPIPPLYLLPTAFYVHIIFQIGPAFQVHTVFLEVELMTGLMMELMMELLKLMLELEVEEEVERYHRGRRPLICRGNIPKPA